MPTKDFFEWSAVQPSIVVETLPGAVCIDVEQAEEQGITELTAIRFLMSAMC